MSTHLELAKRKGRGKDTNFRSRDTDGHEEFRAGASTRRTVTVTAGFWPIPPFRLDLTADTTTHGFQPLYSDHICICLFAAQTYAFASRLPHSSASAVTIEE